jgi:iron(III) transport system ATP-binding protein
MIRTMLKIDGVAKALGDKRVLDNISLDVPKGALVTLLGPSGCGKTTLLRIIAGFLAPESGSVLLNDKPISTPTVIVPPEHRGMGMVFQNYAIWPHMNVLNNVVYGLRVRGTPTDERRSRALEALRLVNLQGLEQRLPSELSGGQQQRVSIARSIVTEPNLLLLDEPLSNLDAKLRKEMLFDLKRIQQQSGITFIYVTHDQAEALSVSDQIVVMNEGRIEQVGSPQDIYDRPTNLFVASFVGGANTLSGEVASVAAEGMVITWGRDGRLLLPSVDPLPVGTQVAVAFKRHGVTLKQLTGSVVPSQTNGEVKRIYFLGQVDEVCVDLDGQEIFAFTSPRACSVGAPVAVHIDPGACQTFRRQPTQSGTPRGVEHARCTRLSP